MGDVYYPGRWNGQPPQPDSPLPPGGGGGTFGGMEVRVAKLEASSEHLVRSMDELRADVRDLKRDGERDFRILFGAIIAVALGLAWMMAKGFKWM